MLTYHQGDVLPPIEVTMKFNGAYPDFSTGYSFSFKVEDASHKVVLTKTTGITGSGTGVITVSLTNSELTNLVAVGKRPTSYRFFVKAIRISDSASANYDEELVITWAP